MLGIFIRHVLNSTYWEFDTFDVDAFFGIVIGHAKPRYLVFYKSSNVFYSNHSLVSTICIYISIRNDT